MSVDVAVFRRERAAAGRPVPQLLADRLDSGRTCTGPEKVGQRFLLHLMTRLGSIPMRPDAGCEFVDRLLAGNVSTETDVFVALTSSLGTVVRNVRAEETAADPADERLVGVQVVNLVLSPGAITLKVRLRMASGDLAGLEVPLSFLLA